MPRFGFRKDDDDDSSSSKSSLFSRKKDSRQDVNPYAQQSQQSDPYSAPMTSLQKTQASMGLTPRGGRPGLPSGPRGGGPAPRASANEPPPAYGGQPSAGGPARNGPSPVNGGYSAGGYGAAAGYGSNRYDNNNNNNNGMSLGRPPSYRSTADSDAGGGGGGSYGGGSARSGARRGGYGGMGGGEDNDTNRQALFGNAPEKYAEQQKQQQQQSAAEAEASGGSGRPGYGERPSAGSPSAYGEGRELTAEEQEDEDVKRMGEETRYLRNETDQSLDRSLMIANQTIETARATMARMHNQRDRLFNAEQNLDSAANHNKIAEHRTAELKHYNRSMFAVKVNNPFTSKQRAAEQAQSALDEHRAERQMREDTRRLAYLSNRNAEDNFTQLDKTIDSSRRLGQSKSGYSSKFNLEDDDEEDIAKEQQIDAKIDLLSGAVGTLNLTARAINQFAEEDLEHLDRITGKSDAVDDGVRANRYKLEQIEKRG